MAIPVYRHNQNRDDWEVASVYDSDDCDSMGRSACDESLHSSGFEDYLYENGRPLVRYSVPEQQPQNYAPVALVRPRWDARYVPGKQSTSTFIVPPPGVIFPCKDLAIAAQDTYWPSPPVQVASSERSAGVVEPPPPPPTLLLSPSSPPCATSALTRLASPTKTNAHGQALHAIPVTGTTVNTHGSPMTPPPPPRYHEPAHTVPPRLAEAGCQAHSGKGMSPPRMPGHDVLTPSPSYALGPGHGSMRRGAQTNEEGRYGGARVGPGDRPDLRPVGMASKPEHEQGFGRRGTALPGTRERKPSVWRRFVRRLSPHVSVGQT